jgi:hypothetical protein
MIRNALLILNALIILGLATHAESASGAIVLGVSAFGCLAIAACNALFIDR